VVVPLIYDCDYWGWGIITEQHFSDGFVPVSKGIMNQDMQYGMINRAGTIIVPIEYDWAFHLNDGLALAGFGGYYGSCSFNWEFCDGVALVDQMGNEVIAVGSYDNIERFSEGFAHVWRGVSNENGFAVYDSAMCGFIDTAGREVVPCIFNDARPFSEGLAAVLIDAKWGYIAIVE